MTQYDPGQSSGEDARWAEPRVARFHGSLPPGAVNLNVDGRRPTAPPEGFGMMRLRTYRAALPGLELSPARVIAAWKADFSSYWPAGNHFYTGGAPIQPGVTGLINLTLPGGMRLYTGALVTFADETSFAFMTLQGHMFSGVITFSSFEEEGMLYAQVQALVSPNDLLYELSYLLGFGAHAEDRFWHAALLNFAHSLGVETQVNQVNKLVDRHLHWRYFGNIWYNAGVRSLLYNLFAPFRSKKGAGES